MMSSVAHLQAKVAHSGQTHKRYRTRIGEGCDEQAASNFSRSEALPRELSGFEIEAFFTFTAAERR
jgi:hypothetical protein